MRSDEQSKDTKKDSETSNANLYICPMHLWFNAKKGILLHTSTICLYIFFLKKNLTCDEV